MFKKTLMAIAAACALSAGALAQSTEDKEDVDDNGHDLTTKAGVVPVVLTRLFVLGPVTVEWDDKPGDKARSICKQLGIGEYHAHESLRRKPQFTTNVYNNPEQTNFAQSAKTDAIEWTWDVWITCKVYDLTLVF